MSGGAATTQRVARLLAPYQITRAEDQVLTCPMYSGAALDAPASSTIDIIRPNGTMLVDGAAAPIVSSVPTYELSAASVPATEAFGPRWSVVWHHAYVAAPVTETVRNEALLQRYQLVPTVTDQDLYDRISALNPSDEAVIHTRSGFEDKRMKAWRMIVRWLIQEGQRPDLVTSPSALHDAQEALTLALVYEDFQSRLNEAWQLMADRYRAEWRDTMRSLTFGVDRDEDGIPDGVRAKAGGAYWFGGFHR